MLLVFPNYQSALDLAIQSSIKIQEYNKSLQSFTTRNFMLELVLVLELQIILKMEFMINWLHGERT